MMKAQLQTTVNSTNMDSAQFSVEEKRALLRKKLAEKKHIAAKSVQKIQKIQDTQQTYPLSYSQQRLWFLNKIDPSTSEYNISSALKFVGELDVSVLEKALLAIVERHNILRTRYREVDGEVEQVVFPVNSIDLPIIDLLVSPKQTKEEAIESLCSDLSSQPYDLSAESCLLRTHLIKLSEQEHILHYTIHHIAADGWSLGIIESDFAEIFEQLVKGVEFKLSELQVQYADYAVWQKDYLNEDYLKEKIDYWTNYLDAIPELHNLPLDYPRPAALSYRGGVFSNNLSAKLSSRIRKLAKENDATLFMAFVAAYSTLLSRLSGEKDIVVGTTIAGRDRQEIEPLVGFFVNTLLLRTNVDGNSSFKEILAECKKSAINAYSNQEVPFDLLVDQLQPVRSLSHNPLFQIMISLDNPEVSESLNLPGLTVTSVEEGNRAAQFDITLDIDDSSDSIEFSWEYALDLFCESML